MNFIFKAMLGMATALLAAYAFAEHSAVADETSARFMDIGCAKNDEAIAVPTPFNEWLTSICTETGQSLVFGVKPKGSQMVSRGGLLPMNFNAEIDIQTREVLAKKVSGKEILFKKIETAKFDLDQISETKASFVKVFPDYALAPDAEVLTLRTVGYNIEQETDLILVVENGIPKRAITIQRPAGKVFAWEVIDEGEWFRRLEIRKKEMKAMAESDAANKD